VKIALLRKKKKKKKKKKNRIFCSEDAYRVGLAASGFPRLRRTICAKAIRCELARAARRIEIRARLTKRVGTRHEPEHKERDEHKIRTFIIRGP
jgi:hypothetical protein